jgi:uncharacterized protein (DUF1800 family)
MGRNLLMALERSVIALNRFGLGARPGDTQRVAADPVGALAAEINPQFAMIKNPLLEGTSDIRTEIAEQRKMQAASRNAANSAAGTSPTPPAASPQPNNQQPPANNSIPSLAELKARSAAAGIMPPARIYSTEVQVRLERALSMPVGFAERLVDFWANHFAVAASTGQEVRALTGAYEREAIRPHVFGKFHDMLVAVTQHAAMLIYLNNAESIGPDSLTGRRGGKGLNENHARELMELHTIGVDGGYTQSDVTQLANILTGWSVSRGEQDGQPIGSFLFRPQAHQPGVFTVMGKAYRQSGEAAGLSVLADLASSPKTALYISNLLVRYFVADDPPKPLVEAVAKAWRDSDGDLRQVSRALVNHELAWTAEGKFKTPQQFMVSAVRALGIKPKPQEAIQVLHSLGQGPWDPPSPQGFDDRAATWMAPDALTTRLDVSEQFAALASPTVDPNALLSDITAGGASRETREAVSRAESRTQALALILMSPEFQRS